MESVASDIVFLLRIDKVVRGKWSTFEQCMNSIPVYSMIIIQTILHCLVTLVEIIE